MYLTLHIMVICLIYIYSCRPTDHTECHSLLVATGNVAAHTHIQALVFSHHRGYYQRSHTHFHHQGNPRSGITRDFLLVTVPGEGGCGVSGHRAGEEHIRRLYDCHGGLQHHHHGSNWEEGGREGGRGEGGREGGGRITTTPTRT